MEEYGCCVARRWLSKEVAFDVGIGPVPDTLLGCTDEKAIFEGTMKGEELDLDVSCSADSARKCDSCNCGDDSGVCSSFEPSLMSCWRY
jgi:hypothetical protein